MGSDFTGRDLPISSILDMFRFPNNFVISSYTSVISSLSVSIFCQNNRFFLSFSIMTICFCLCISDVIHNLIFSSFNGHDDYGMLIRT